MDTNNDKINKVDFRKLTLELIKNSNIDYDDLDDKVEKKKIYNKYYQRIYRKFSGKKKEQNRKYRLNNKKICNDASRDYYHKNRDRLLIIMRENYYKRKAKNLL